MSSLQKFHRRTLYIPSGPATWPPTAIGGGDATNGFWLGDGYFNALIVAPKSTEVNGYLWGSYGTVRGTTSTTNGLANTNTLYGFGSAAHPAAYYAKTQTTGGYNTWYIPALGELNTLYSNKSAVPFATANSFVVSTYHFSSTENNGKYVWCQRFDTGGQYSGGGKLNGGYYVRPTRRVGLATTVGQGSDTSGYWLGNTGLFGSYKMIAAPKSTEVVANFGWGSYGTARGITSTTNGLANTNTLFGFGSAAHPPAYYCRALTTGGYNTWYLPAKDELNTLYSNKSAVPFATANAFDTYAYWSSTESDSTLAWGQYMGNGTKVNPSKNGGSYFVRPVRAVGTLAIGDGNDTQGYWLGNTGLFGAYKLIAAPKSTEVQRAWGSLGTLRVTTSTNDGLANTNTLFGFGSAAHPAAYYAKALTTGGYNTWYLPAKDELNTLYVNKSAIPFATANSFVGGIYWTSTEENGGYAFAQNVGTGAQGSDTKASSFYIRPVRTVGTLAIGDGNDTQGYWLGTAGDGVSKLIAAPKSTEAHRTWGSSGTVRGTTSTTNGVANTTTLFGFGSAAHPAAYYCRALTTGGYNTWYLPARNELATLYANRLVVPFATANSLRPVASYLSSTEKNGGYVWIQTTYQTDTPKTTGAYVRAVRRV